MITKEIQDEAWEKAKPKFKVGDKVRMICVPMYLAGEYDEISNITEYGTYHLKGLKVILDESELEPYIEPTKTNNDLENKELNLVEIIEGYKGEKFFSSVHGEVTFYEKSFSQKDKYHLFFEKEDGESFYTLWNGSFGRGIYPIIYPSYVLYKKYPLDAKKAWEEWLKLQKPRRWRAKKKEYYWYLDRRFISKGCIEGANIDFDNTNYRNGNYFRTSSEAQQAAELIKETLIKFHESKLD